MIASSMTTWTIDKTRAGERLDAFLRKERSDLSRSALQKQIKRGAFTVNGKTVAVHRFLKMGDEVAWEIEKPKLQPPTPPLSGGLDRVPMALIPPIVSETPDWIVIDKPAGLLVHPDAVTKHPTLVDWLMEHDPAIARVGENPERPGIVHRLDREVSGLMVIAKTPQAYESLQQQFAKHETKKTYLALVHGELPKDEGDIKFRIARSTSKARMAARPEHEDGGRAAWTHYVVKQRWVGATLVELEILSGRTHQIRAHLHALGHPIIGDPIYTLRKTDRNIVAPRLMLQSIGLEFRDPTDGDLRTFSLNPDPLFSSLLPPPASKPLASDL